MAGIATGYALVALVYNGGGVSKRASCIARVEDIGPDGRTDKVLCDQRGLMFTQVPEERVVAGDEPCIFCSRIMAAELHNLRD